MTYNKESVDAMKMEEKQETTLELIKEAIKLVDDHSKVLFKELDKVGSKIANKYEKKFEKFKAKVEDTIEQVKDSKTVEMLDKAVKKAISLFDDFCKFADKFCQKHQINEKVSTAMNNVVDKLKEVGEEAKKASTKFADAARERIANKGKALERI